MDSHLRLASGHATDTTANTASVIEFDFAGMTRPHQTPGGNLDSSAIGNLEQRLTGFGRNRDVIGHEMDLNCHSFETVIELH